MIIFNLFFTENQHRQLEVNPWVLTLLGVGAGTMAVVLLVGVAIRVHARRRGAERSGGGGGGGAGRGGVGKCTESATNKVRKKVLNFSCR